MYWTLQLYIYIVVLMVFFFFSFWCRGVFFGGKYIKENKNEFVCSGL